MQGVFAGIDAGGTPVKIRLADRSGQLNSNSVLESKGYQNAAGANVALAVAMALLWSGANFIYGISAHRMGSLGLVLGWPVYMAMIVLTANAWGLLMGEWRNSGRRSMIWASTGCLLLIAGIWMIVSVVSIK